MGEGAHDYIKTHGAANALQSEGLKECTFFEKFEIKIERLETCYHISEHQSIILQQKRGPK